MIKYLFFQNGTTEGNPTIGVYPNDSALIPASRLSDMEISADGTDLTLSFKSMLQGKGVNTEIVLSITEDSGAEVMSAIAEELALGENGFVTIADEYNSEFIHGDITAIETTLDGSFT